MITINEIKRYLDIAIKRDINRVVIDSRKVLPGDLFVALKGEHVDGNDYVNQAFAAGAECAICAKTANVELQYRDRTVFVDNTLQALQDLGWFARKCSSAKIIGITGSVGKSTTSAMIAESWQPMVRTFFCGTNYNGQIGLPITLSMLPRNIDIAAIEMGMSQAGELSRLVDIANPNSVIITAIGESHLEFFKDSRDIAKAKSEIISKGQQFCILPRDSEYYSILERRANEQQVLVYSFGSNPRSTIRLLSHTVDDTGMGHANFRLENKIYSVVLNSPKKSFALSALISILGGYLHGVDIEDIIAKLSQFQIRAGRGNVIQLGLNSIAINDCYNASPSSMKESVSCLKYYKQQNKIAILGDMGELGDKANDFHLALYDTIMNSGASKVYLVGVQMRDLYLRLNDKIDVVYGENIDSIYKLIKEPAEDTVYLLKASHFMGFENVLEYIKNIYKIEDKNAAFESN